MGQPTLCTAERTDWIVDLLRTGLSIADASKVEGLGESSYHAWRARGEAERTRLDLDPRRRTGTHRGRVLGVLGGRGARPTAAKARAVEVIHQAYDGWNETTTVETHKVLADDAVNVIERKVTTVRKFNWRAALVFLERRSVEEWARRMSRMETPAEVAAAVGSATP